MVKAKARDLKVWILGVPLDELNRQEVLSTIVSTVKDYDYVPSYIATVNLDYIANAISWFGIKDREFIRVLREAKVSCADGMPLVFLSRLLGNPLPERVTGQDLFPLIAREFSQAGRSLFLLGGTKEILEQCSKKLLLENPLIKIAGELSPGIKVAREYGRAPQKDQIILDKINEASPDLLFLQLGSPKQELWYSRVQNELKVPATIGIGGTFERYTGYIKRAPDWMQKRGLEWVFRLIKEPGRLFKRYFLDGLKFLWLGLPLLTYFYLNKWITALIHCNRCLDGCEEAPYLFLSPDHNIIITKLPCLLNREEAVKFRAFFDDAREQDAIIVDFKNLRHLDLNGFYLLFELWDFARRHQKRIFAIDIPVNILHLLKLNRLYDVLKPDITDIEGILRSLNTTDLFESVKQENSVISLSFLGAMTNDRDYDSIMRNLLNMMEGKRVSVNLDYVSEIESRGRSFLAQLRERL